MMMGIAALNPSYLADMNKSIYPLFLAFLTSCVIAGSPQRIEVAEAPIDYQEAISQTEVIQGTDRKSELRRCIKHWDALRVQRVGLDDSFSGEENAVLLEIGNSGFPQYNYVRIDGSVLKSSFGKAVDISGSDLAGQLQELYANPSVDLPGSASADVDDGDCYFLTIFAAGTRRSAAIYGSPESTRTGLLIKEVLEIARPKRASAR